MRVTLRLLQVIPVLAIMIPSSNHVIPAGWNKSDYTTEGVIYGVDTLNKMEGRSSAYIHYNGEYLPSRAILIQSIEAQPYLNKRICVTGYVKTRDIQSSTFFTRIDSQKVMIAYTSDQLINKSITSNQDWTEYKMTLDVSEGAEKITFGVSSYGRGTVWLDKFNINTVPKNGPSNDVVLNWTMERRTRKSNTYESCLPNKFPTNLSFEKE